MEPLEVIDFFLEQFQGVSLLGTNGEVSQTCKIEQVDRTCQAAVR
jgi:hypothetical protein